MNEVPCADTTCPTYSTLAYPSLVFLGLTAMLNSRSRLNTFRTSAGNVSGSLSWISTSSMYSLQMRYTPYNPMATLVHWYKPPTALNAVSALEALASLACCMFGMGQPSNPLVVALSMTKSRVSLNSPLGLQTGCTWLQWFALDSSMTSSLSSASTWVRIACCFSAE